MKKKTITSLILLGLVGVLIWGCENNLEDVVNEVSEDPLMEVAELSSQLSSGIDLTLSSRSGVRPEDAAYGDRPNRDFGGGHGRGNMTMCFLKYNHDPNLQVISIAERIGERLNFWMFASLGVDVKHYNQDGVLVELEITERPERGFWKDENSPRIARTVIDFGEGFTVDRGDNNIQISGMITIDRSFTDNQLTETVTLQNFILNDALIEGTKSSIRSFDKETGDGQMSSTVSNGKFTFSDGTTADWVSSKSRSISIVINEDRGIPKSGTSTSSSETIITQRDGTILYSHKTTSPLVSDMECAFSNRRGRKPSSGIVETVYGENRLEIDFGSGDCSSPITVTINGEEVVVGG
ncbi:MAG: hypothetical protein RLO12_20045 [Fulvivirga sp.]